MRNALYTIATNGLMAATLWSGGAAADTAIHLTDKGERPALVFIPGLNSGSARSLREAFFRDTRAMLGRSMHYVEARLDPQLFFRANRQQIVNLDYIAAIEPWIGDGLMIRMQDGTEVEVSRRQARELKLRLEM